VITGGDSAIRRPPKSRSSHPTQSVNPVMEVLIAEVPFYSLRKKPATRQGWQGHSITSEWLLCVEEIGERLRVRRSHARHVIPARSRVQAGIRTE
jgi:hypothetical protein